MNTIFPIIFLLATGTWFAAIIGAGVVAFIQKANGTFTTIVLGIAAGVILMVSFIELLHPAIHIAETSLSAPAWVVVPGAFALGFAATFFLDRYITRLKACKCDDKDAPRTHKQGLMLFCALSTHSIPEGLALGVLLGGVGGHANFAAVIPLVMAVALHKLPEAAAISVAFQKDGMSSLRSFLLGQASGFLGFGAGLLGFVVSVSINSVMAYAMAFAAGAMVWVAVHELIPAGAMHSQRHRYLTTIGVVAGVLMMLFVDIALHDHCHGHQHIECCIEDEEYEAETTNMERGYTHIVTGRFDTATRAGDVTVP